MFGFEMRDVLYAAAFAAALVIFVMNILMPFFVYKIKNEVVSINQKLTARDSEKN